MRLMFCCEAQTAAKQVCYPADDRTGELLYVKMQDILRDNSYDDIKTHQKHQNLKEISTHNSNTIQKTPKTTT